MRIAFYKGCGTWWDRAIRLATLSRYSHVELVFGSGPWLSSSPRDGGVRYKAINPDPDHWDIYEVPTRYLPDVETLTHKANARVGAKYDWLGAFNSVLPFRKQDPAKWFCSELVADLLGMPRPHKETPGSLNRKIRRELRYKGDTETWTRRLSFWVRSLICSQ